MNASTPQACDFCRLPVPRSRRGANDASPAFCCLGCRLAADITCARGAPGQVNWMLTRLGLAAFCAMIVMMFSMYLYRQQFADASSASAVAVRLGSVMRYLSLLFATPVFVLLAPPIATAAMREWRRGVVSTDALIVVGVAAAFAYSYASTLRDVGATYFETGSVVLVFMTLGRWLEANGKLRASAAVTALESLLPDTVNVTRDGVAQRVRTQDVAVGDLLLVHAGERIAADGTVESGCAFVDEQLLTGESTPVVRDTGDSVRAGALNIDGLLTIRATAVGARSALGRLIDILREARQSRGRFERLTERVASRFVPVTIALALLAAALGFSRAGVSESVMSFLAVLLIACPCALGIATPAAMWVALGRAAEDHVLISGGEAIERLARIRAICFDKTGTLTTGHATVECVITADGIVPSEALAVAAGLSRGSVHAIARGIAEYAKSNGTTSDSFDEIRTVSGRGVTGRRGQTDAALGNVAHMQERGMNIDERLSASLQGAMDSGSPVTCIAWDGHVRAVFTFSETLRPEAAGVMRRLHGLGIQCAILTGDHAARGRIIAGALGTDTKTELTPVQKVEQLRRMQRDIGLVAMVGDGLNDAPAMAAADVGIALGCGADLTREQAGVCLLANDLDGVVHTLELARRAVRTIKVNLFWAFAYNIIGVGLALAGRLNPVFAAFAMVASSIFVLSNSLRLGARPAKSARSPEKNVPGPTYAAIRPNAGAA